MNNYYNYRGNIIKEKSVPWICDSHQGYTSQTVPGNTMAAFDRAYKNGADSIEVDARLASDGKYVCYHNESVTVGGITYTIENETSSTLTSLILSVDPVYGDCKIPLLETVLNFCAYTGMIANIDCKSVTPESIAKLVVDCGMSGKSMYANLQRSDAPTIIANDPNAAFLIGYTEERLTTWASTLSDFRIINKSYMYGESISYDVLEKVRRAGFKYMLVDVNSTTNMPYNPDAIEYQSNVNIQALNKTYIESLDFGI